MFEKIKEENAKRKSEKKKRILEESAKAALSQQKIIEEEKVKIQAEKSRLLSLNDKELMVELIFAIRGLYNKVTEIETQQGEIVRRIEGIESDIASLASDVSNLESVISSDE